MHQLERELTATVQHNCHISDARHGADYGMCTYLLKMREFYRWEKGLGFSDQLPKDELGDWLTEREALWQEMLEMDFIPLSVDGQEYDPFDTDGINQVLEQKGLVYSAGLLHGARPGFFLGRLAQREQPVDGFTLWVADKELARGLFSPPAMTCGRTIFLRRESLRRFLWEKYEIWRWKRLDNALGKAIASYPFESDLSRALDQMTDSEVSVVREHEIGEYLAGQELGEGWNEMLMGLALTPAEIMARAVRDYMADCSRTLPMLLEKDNAASLHFFMGNLSGMRKLIAPGLQAAYSAWLDNGNKSGLQQWAEQGQQHWVILAKKMQELHGQFGADAAEPIKLLVESSYL